MSDLEVMKKQRDEWKYEAKALRAALAAIYNIREIETVRVFVTKFVGTQA